MAENPLAGRRLLLVSTGGPKKRFILQKLHKLGVKLTVVNGEKNWAEPYVDHWVIADVNNHASVMRKLETHRVKHPDEFPEGVVTFWEESTLLVSRLAERFGWSGIPYRVAKQTRNKHLFREFCRSQGLPTPDSQLIRDEADLQLVAQTFRFPIVLKPVFGSSSAFVIKVNTTDDLFPTYEFIQRHINTHDDSKEWQSLNLMAETYLDGDEVDIDLLLQNGKVKYSVVTDNAVTKEPYFIETRSSMPSALPQEAQTQLIEMAEEVLEKLGIMQGCIHFEAKLTRQGPVPIEVNMRMGGDEVYLANKSVWKVDLIEASAKIALGIHLPRHLAIDKPATYFTAQVLQAEESGILVNVDLPDALEKDTRVKEFHFTKQVGDPILTPPHGYDILGWVAATGDNTPNAQENLEEILDQIEFKVARFQSTSTLGRTTRQRAIGSATLQQSLLKGASRLVKISHKDPQTLRIGVVGNRYESGLIEQALTSATQSVVEQLEASGHTTSFYDFNELPEVLMRLDRGNVDLIFNLCERINNSPLLRPHAAALLDSLNLPYTGCGPFTQALCLDKIRVKKLLQFHNIPTPRWDYAHEVSDTINPELEYPLIVKPAGSDNAVGVSNDSVVRTPQELARQLEYVIHELHSPALVEEFIDGDEYDIGILGNHDDDLQVLPLLRTRFTGKQADHWPIYSYASKWGLDPESGHAIQQECPPKRVNHKLIQLISEIALDAYRIMHCQDYAKVECRTDAHGNPYVIEINSNPSLAAQDSMASMAQVAGLTHAELLEKIIVLATTRYQSLPPYHHLQGAPL